MNIEKNIYLLAAFLLLIAYSSFVYNMESVAGTDIFEAVEAGDEVRVLELIKADPSCVNGVPDENGLILESPLFIAASNGRYANIVKILIKYGAKVEQCSEYGDDGHFTPLLAAAGSKGPAQVTSDWGGTALHYEIEDGGGHPEIVQALIDAGVDVNAQNDEGRTALHLAAEGGNEDDYTIVKMLVAAGANLDLCDEYKDGSTALQEAIWTEAERCWGTEMSELLSGYERLIERAESPERKKEIACGLAMATHERLSKDSPLFLLPQELLCYISQLTIAAEIYDARQPHDESEDYVDILEDEDYEDQDFEDKMDIVRAIWIGNLDRVKMIMREDPAAATRLDENTGMTPLHYAAVWNRLEITQELIRHGAHIDQQNNEGITPLQAAVINKHRAIIQALLGARGRGINESIAEARARALDAHPSHDEEEIQDVDQYEAPQITGPVKRTAPSEAEGQPVAKRK